MRSLILASGSPRRKELLGKLAPEFSIVVPQVDESILEGSVPNDRLPLEESKLKAYSVLKDHPEARILACDTVVILDDEILGKPKDEEDAFRMLSKESGKKQIVLSGYTYLDGENEISRSVKTVVHFRKLSPEEIREYIEKCRPLDKAGAYGIQDDYPLIELIEGSYDNVMGLPTEDLKKHVFR